MIVAALGVNAKQSFPASYPSSGTLSIDQSMLNKLNARLMAQGSSLRLDFDNLTWSNLSIALYGTASYASQLQTLNGGASSPFEVSSGWFSDTMCWIDSDYCYAEVMVRLPAGQSLSQFINNTQPAPPPVAQTPVEPPPPPVINPPVTPPPLPPQVADAQPVTPPPPPPAVDAQPVTPPPPPPAVDAQPAQPQLRITFQGISYAGGDNVATFRANQDLTAAGITEDEVDVSNCEGVVDRDVQINGRMIKVFFNISADAPNVCQGSITVQDASQNFTFTIQDSPDSQ